MKSELEKYAEAYGHAQWEDLDPALGDPAEHWDEAARSYIAGALHLLEVAEKWCEEQRITLPSFNKLAGEWDELLDFLRAYCGKGEEK